MKLETTSEQRKRALGLAAQATPAPWDIEDVNLVTRTPRTIAVFPLGGAPSWIVKADVELVATARTFAPAAARDVDALIGLLRKALLWVPRYDDTTLHDAIEEALANQGD